MCACGEIDPDDVLDLISGLVDKSLVEMRETADVARYRMLETVRQYAAERLLDVGEMEFMRRRHAEYFFALVVEAEPNLTTPRRRGWVERLHAELDNIRQTLAWSRDKDHELHMRIVGMLHWFWYATGQWPEARQWLRSALILPISDRPTRDRAAVLFSAGAIAALQARPESAQVHLVEAESLATKLGDRRLAAYVRNYRAMAFTQVGSPDAEAVVKLAQPWFRETNDLYGLRLNFLLLGTFHLNEGHIQAAVDAAEEGVRVARVFGLDRELAIALQQLGMILTKQGDTRRATALFRESLEALQRDPHLLFLSRSLEMLASCIVEQSAMDAAAQIYGSAEAIRETIGARMWQMDRVRHAPAIEAARRSMGEEAFDAARAVGRARGANEALEFALDAAADGGFVDHDEPTTHTAEYAVAVPREPVPPQAALRVVSLGSLDVVVDGSPVPPKAWGYVKARELLLFLLSHPDGRTREQVGAAPLARCVVRAGP